MSQNHRWDQPRDLSPEGRKMKHICLCVCGNSQLGAAKPRRETCTLEQVGSKVQNRGPPPLTLGIKELSLRSSRFPAISHTHLGLCFSHPHCPSQPIKDKAPEPLVPTRLPALKWPYIHGQRHRPSNFPMAASGGDGLGGTSAGGTLTPQSG